MSVPEDHGVSAKLSLRLSKPPPCGKMRE